MEDRILVHAPTGKDARLAVDVLSSDGLVGSVCHSVGELMIELAHGAGAVLLVEESLADHALPALIDYVASQPTWSDLPILLLTHRGADSPDLEFAAHRLGNVTLLERPLRAVTLISASRAALRARQRQYKVREVEQRKDEFLASLGHELRNPLAPIRTAMGVLKSRHPDNPALVQVSDLVERQIVHLTRLVDDLLDVARITNGKVELQRKIIRLQDVIEHAVEICGQLLKKSGHRLEIQRPEHDVFLFADHARLVQSIANVLINAIKFTTRPDVIHLLVEVDGETIVFRIRDPGLGIEQDALSRIFDMFAQSHPAPGQIRGGLGIGLSLARQFTQMHGGRIAAQSEGLGHGSEFVISLPIVCHGEGGSTSAPAARRMAWGDKGVAILVVDDNRDAADMLASYLRLDGYDVRTAYDGNEALVQLECGLPDAVLLDLGMPGLNGYETAQCLRRYPGAERVAVLALTGWGHDEARYRAAAAGFDDHLVKPIDFDVLKQRLHQAVGKRLQTLTPL